MVKLNICLNRITFILSKVKTVGQSSNPEYIKSIYTGIALPQKTIIKLDNKQEAPVFKPDLGEKANTHGELTITILGFFFCLKVCNHFRARKWKSSKETVLLSDEAKFRHEARIYGEKHWEEAECVYVGGKRTGGKVYVRVYHSSLDKC